MRAVLCREFGPPETLTVETLPDPVPGPGQVVVDIACAALNFFDTLIIENRYQSKPKLPFSPGAELAGRIAAVGDGVDPWSGKTQEPANFGEGQWDELSVNASWRVGFRGDA